LVAGVIAALLISTLTHGLLAGLASALPYLLPPVLLLFVLLARRYPGERALLMLMRPDRRRRSRMRFRGITLGQEPRVVVPRGGRLIASSLAVRPPPASVSLR
jgi:hypothetical protein